MTTTILACETIKCELELAIAETKVNYPAYYIKSGLHDKPDYLKEEIQKSIDKIKDASLILLAFGYCGNSMLGIKANQSKLIMPKVDDCISLLLGSDEKRRNLTNKTGAYFFTQGWLQYESSLLSEYERCINKYGKVRAFKIMKAMLSHYKRFMIINTGAYPVESIVHKVADFAAEFNITHSVCDGSLRLVHKLLTGPWDDEFVIIDPGEEFLLGDFFDDGGC